MLDHLQRGEHWPRPGPEETRTDPNLTPAVQTLREDGTGTVYPPFMDLIALVLESLYQMTPLCEATRCWLDNIQTFSLSSTYALENQFLGEIAACPALNSEDHAKVATLLQHRKINSVGYPIIRPYDVVKEAFAEPIRPRPLAACATRLSSQQPPRVWTPEEALEAREFQKYMATKRDLSRCARSDETQVPPRDDSSMNTLPENHTSLNIDWILDTYSNPTSDRLAISKGAINETTSNLTRSPLKTSPRRLAARQWPGRICAAKALDRERV